MDIKYVTFIRIPVHNTNIEGYKTLNKYFRNTIGSLNTTALGIIIIYNTYADVKKLN